eukprot:SAG22_NODE_17505_length_303_cov_1.421569_1_plen_24_part_10
MPPLPGIAAVAPRRYSYTAVYMLR